MGRGEYYDDRADVFSFGLILFEAMNMTLPFPKWEKRQGVILAMKVATEGFRPTFDPNALEKWPPEICQLMKECWSDEIKERPRFSVIVPRLRDVIEKYYSGHARQLSDSEVDIIGIPVL